MIQSTQKIIKIGTSGGVTIPAKDLKRQNLAIGDEVEVTVRPLRKHTSGDKKVINTAKKILSDYQSDFTSLASR